MSETFHPGTPAQVPVAVTSAFGTTFQLSMETAADYLLHPVFLRFAMICLCIRALLDQGDDIRLLQGWQVAVLWLIVALGSVAVLMAVIGLLRLLSRAGAGRRVYTPLLFLPLVVAGEYLTQGVIGIFHEGYAKPFEQALIDMTRDLLVLMMFDAFHALYVAPQHPLVRDELERPPHPVEGVRRPGAERPEMVEVPAAAEVLEGTPAPMAEAEVVRIAERVFPLADLLSVRTEDHYLSVVARTGRSMLRAKLSDIGALHDGRHGVQINRSQWVAFAAIREMREERSGQIVLELETGDSATVARSRRLVFLQLWQGVLRRRSA